MKKQWLLVFPTSLLLSCVAGCPRAPFDAAIHSTSASAPPLETYWEEGANQIFRADYAFQVVWCADANCKPPLDPIGPCTKAVVGKAEKDKRGNVRFYAGTCKISKNAETSTSGTPLAKAYFYAFDPTDPLIKSKNPTLYGIPDNIQQCNPQCGKGALSK